MKKLLLMALAMTCLWTTTHAQVGINTTTPDAILDVEATDSGILIPRVALTAANVAAPIDSPTISELIYNTETAGTGVNAVTPGYYYWNGTVWVRLNAGTDATTNWSLTGNAGTNPANNFLGTVTNQPLVFRTNNLERMRIWNNGQVAVNFAGAPPAGDVFASIAGGGDYAISSYTLGSGAALYGQTNGTGRAAEFVKPNTDDTNSVVAIFNDGLGRGLNVQNDNNSNNETTIFVSNISNSTEEDVASVWSQSHAISSGVFLSDLRHNSTTALTGQYLGGGPYDGAGVFGYSNAIVGRGYGVIGEGRRYGVYANGNLGASGVKSFMIDHPQDPENKFLYHYSIESPEVLNLYRGTAEFDSQGNAMVRLPEYFDSININFSYQLTPVGAAMPNLFISKEIENGQFVISGGVPHKKVSWVVYAERNDEWVKQNKEFIGVEVEKKPHQKGKYLIPNLYGQPEEKGIFYNNIKEFQKEETYQEIDSQRTENINTIKNTLQAE